MANTTDPSAPERADAKKSYLALFLVVFISLVGFGIVIPVFPFFGRMVGATAEEITLAMAAYSAGQFIGAPIWGRLSDRYGRRPILLWSLFASIFTYILMAHATDIWTLGLARLLGGLMAGNIAAAFAYVGDVTTDETRPGAMGLLGAAFGSGFIFGPAIGGVIGGSNPDPLDFIYIGYVSAAFTFIAAVLTFFTVPESLSPERRRAAGQSRGPSNFTIMSLMAAKPVVFWLAMIMFISTSAGALMEATLAFFGSDRFGWGPLEIGLSFGLIGLIAAIVQGVGTAPLARRFGEARIMSNSLLVWGLALAFIGLATREWMVAIGLAFMALGVGLFSPAFQSYTAAKSNDTDRGLIMGVTQSAGSLGRVIGPAIAGIIYVGVGQSAPFVIGGLVLVMCWALSLYTVTRFGRTKPVTPIQADA